MAVDQSVPMLLSNDTLNLLAARCDLSIRRPREDWHNAPAPRGDRIHEPPPRIRIDQFRRRRRWHAPTLEERPFQLFHYRLRLLWIPSLLRNRCAPCHDTGGLGARLRVLADVKK